MVSSLGSTLIAMCFKLSNFIVYSKESRKSATALKLEYK